MRNKIIGLLVFSLIFVPSLVFGQSSNATAELQAKIQALLAQIKLLQEELAKMQGTEGDFCYTFNKNLRVGDRSEAIAPLLKAFFREGIVDSATAKNLSQEEFNENLASYVSEFQEKYASEILTPNNLRRGTGFLGASTRAKLNKLYGCGNNRPPVTPPPTYSCQTDNDCKELTCVGGGFAHEQCVSNKCYISDSVKNKCSGGTIQPSITVLSPNGGETWTPGTTQYIKWNSSNISSSYPWVLIDLNIKNDMYGDIGATTIAENLPNTSGTGTYLWTIPPDFKWLGSSYKIRISTSPIGASDSSDSYFTIASSLQTNLPPIIDGVTGPTTLKAGETGTWTVKAHDPENGSLSYGINWGDNTGASGGGASSNSITSSAIQTTSFTHSYATAGMYKVGFTVTDAKGLVAQSFISVEVSNVSTTPSITVLSPNGGEIWEPGTTQYIKWSSSNVSSYPWVLIDLVNTDGGVTTGLTTIAENISNVSGNGLYTWVIPSDFKWTGGNYKIRISTSPIGVADTSDSHFSIISPIPLPPPIQSVTLTPGHDHYFQVKSGTLTFGDVSNGGFPSAKSVLLSDAMVFVFRTGDNKPAWNDSASATYYYKDGKWYKFGSGLAEIPAVTPIPAYFVIRNATNASSATLTLSSNVTFHGSVPLNQQPKPWDYQVGTYGKLSASVVSPVSSSVVAGGAGAAMARFNLDTTGSIEDMKFTTLMAKLTYSLGKSTDLTNCQLFDGSTALTTGTKVVNPSYASTANYNFVFDTPIVVAKGSVKTIDLRCNISASAIAGASYSWGLPLYGVLEMTGATSGAHITPTVNVNDNGYSVTVGAPNSPTSPESGGTTSEAEKLRNIANALAGIQAVIDQIKATR